MDEKTNINLIGREYDKFGNGIDQKEIRLFKCIFK